MKFQAVGSKRMLFILNHKISVYSVDWRAVIHILLALIVQYKYGSPKSESTLMRRVPKLLFMPLLLRNWIAAIPC